MYVPLDLLHGWVNAVAGVNPVTAMVEGGRDLISGGNPDAALAFGAAVGLAVLATAWAVLGLRRAEAAGG